MADTAFYRGEGGYVWEMSLPLSAQHSRDEQEGRLVQVNQDGSPFTGEPETPKSPARKRAAKAPSKEEETG
jgi:hypothetical protein